MPPANSRRASVGGSPEARRSGGPESSADSWQWSQVGLPGAFYECPRWRAGRWWTSDFYADEVVSFGVDGDRRVEARVHGHPAGLGWLPDGSLLVVSMDDHVVLRRGVDGELTVHADLSPFCGGPANDMVVAGDGTAYVGNFGFDLDGGAQPVTTVLAMVTPDGVSRVAAEDLFFPNGAVITPDGTTLVVAETFASRHTAFTLAADGSLRDRRVWAQVEAAPGPGPVAEMLLGARYAPDGCAMDARLGLWSADSLHGRVCHVVEGGDITEQRALPEGLLAFACALGGHDGRTLLVTAAPDFSPGLRAAARDSVLLTTRVAVPAA